MVRKPIPPEFDSVREAARRALGPIKPADKQTKAEKEFLFNAQRSEAGRALPPYYLVYFLLVDLLGFGNLGQFEKISWSIPIDFNGKAYLIEHRKFGVGVFVENTNTDEDGARKIVIHIQKAVKAAQPFFDWLANEAVKASELNVVNNSGALFARYSFFREAHKTKAQEAEDRKEETITEKGQSKSGDSWTITKFPGFQLRREADWLALAAIDAFYSWTEHILIHIAILSGKASSGTAVAELAAADWPDKFKYVIPVSEAEAKRHFDRLVEIRRELRNFVAHGAFGKDGKAFNFHSGAGAVPLLLPHRRRKGSFTIGESLTFDDDAALKCIDAFVDFLWRGSRAPAKIYIDSQLPVVLTMAKSGEYAEAMESSADMKEFVDYLAERFDRSVNMDW